MIVEKENSIYLKNPGCTIIYYACKCKKIKINYHNNPLLSTGMKLGHQTRGCPSIHT